MPAEYHHGVRVIELANGARPIRTVNTGIIGLVATADDADAAAFPLDTPVLIAGNQALIGKAGTTGTLKRALEAIFKQIAPVIVVVRVPEEPIEADQNEAVIGTVTAQGQYTGLKALLAAKAQLGVTPRIIGAPGLDTQAVATEIGSVCDRLRAFGYVAGQGDTVSAAILYRSNFGSKRLMTIWPKFKGWDGQSLEATAVALGLRARIDNDIGWHKTISNVAVNGVVGLTKDVYFDLQSTATDADLLNADEVTTLIRQDGFRLWGSRTCSDDPVYAFESAVRTGDVLADTIAEAHLWAIDKPMSKTLIHDIIEGINAKMRHLKSLGYIVDAEAWLDPAKNEVTTLQAGELHIDYEFTPVPPLENLMFYQSITNEYLIQLVQ